MTSTLFLMSQYTESLLGVAICLLPSEVPDSVSQGESDSKPVIVGKLVVSEGRIRSSITYNSNASIDITISPRHQGKGYGREAVNWALDWAFGHGNMHTVSISAFSFNTGAAELYRDMGFVDEGRRRQVIWFHRAWHDDLLFSMTMKECAALRKAA